MGNSPSCPSAPSCPAVQACPKCQAPVFIDFNNVSINTLPDGSIVFGDSSCRSLRANSLLIFLPL